MYTVKDFCINCFYAKQNKMTKNEFQSTSCDERKFCRIKHNMKIFLHILFCFFSMFGCSVFVSFEISLRKGFFVSGLEWTNRSDGRRLRDIISTFTSDTKLFIRLNKILREKILTSKQFALFEPFWCKPEVTIDKMKPLKHNFIKCLSSQ